ncbi:hypothetical protein LCGC14_3153580, partial [marine sediment metagenome]
RLVHAQRSEDALGDELLPGLARDLRRQQPSHHEHHVLILPARPEVPAGAEVAELGEELLAREVQPVPCVVVPRQPGAMAEQVARGHALAGHPVVQAEVLHVLADGAVPIEFAFVDEHAKLRPAVRGAGNRERFNFWCNQLLYTRATTKACCAWGQLEAALKVAREEKDPARRKTLAVENVLPLYQELVACVGEAYGLLMATVTDIGGIQTVINWEGHNGLLGIEKTGRELTEMLGGPLPKDAAITAQYQGEPRLIVPTVRSLLEKGATLKLKVIVLDNRRPQEAALFWKPLGAAGDYRKVPLQHVGRAVYTVSLLAVDGDIEYNIRATTADGTKLI